MTSDTYLRMYRVVQQIPAGKVATYGQVARLAGLPGQARQVGYALHALPDNSPVPWHRVINARGTVSVRSDGDSELCQQILLQAEGVDCTLNGQALLQRYQWTSAPDSLSYSRKKATR